MEYETIPKFKIFILEDTKAFSRQGRVYGLDSTEHKEFDSYEDALNWIQNDGSRQTEYIIMEVFRKP